MLAKFISSPNSLFSVEELGEVDGTMDKDIKEVEGAIKVALDLFSLIELPFVLIEGEERDTSVDCKFVSESVSGGTVEDVFSQVVESDKPTGKSE